MILYTFEVMIARRGGCNLRTVTVEASSAIEAMDIAESLFCERGEIARSATLYRAP